MPWIILTRVTHRFSDCIYCSEPNGSAEHVVQAAVGALRTDRRVACDDCNNGFSDIDGALANDLRPLNALLGVLHGRTKEAISATFDDTMTGRTFVLSSAKVQHPDATVIQDETTSDGVRHLYAVASTQQQADDFVRQIRNEGRPFQVRRETVPLLFTSPLVTMWNFGGPKTLRGVAKAALNVLALRYPERAREPWLKRLKGFVKGDTDFDCPVTYEYGSEPDPRLPPDSFTFQHRFVIAFDASSGEAYAKVSLLGVVDLCIRLGVSAFPESETFIYDVDVLAKRPPDDIHVGVVSGAALNPPARPTENPAPFVSERLVRLNRKRDELLWEREADGLVQALNSARDAPEFDRHELVLGALGGQHQRLLNLTSLFARDIRAHLTRELGEQGRALAGAFDPFAKHDAASKTGVTDLSYMSVEMLRHVIAEHLLEILRTRPIDKVELRGYLEGHRGVAVVGQYLFEQVKKHHPWLQEKAASSEND